MGKNTAADIDLFHDWLSYLEEFKEPPNEPELIADGRIQTRRTWDNFRWFLLKLVAIYGRFGQNMFPRHATVAEDFGLSRRTVERWLQTAVSLGLLSRTYHTGKLGGVTAAYGVRPFWQKPADKAPKPITPKPLVEDDWPSEDAPKRRQTSPEMLAELAARGQTGAKKP